jgi:hypothetical protein
MHHFLSKEPYQTVRGCVNNLYFENCPLLDLEDGTDSLSQNLSKKLLLLATQKSTVLICFMAEA